MGASFGRFAGKSVFASQGGAGVFYLTTGQYRAGGSGGNPLSIPVMSATSVTDQERCILYGQEDGSIRIQLGSLLWVTLNTGLGWLMLSPDFTQAAGFVFGGDPPGQRWQVQTPSGPATVVYTVGGASPILGINDGPGVLDTFAPQPVTPSLDEVLQEKACRGGNFRQVNLQGQNLSGVDFTGADFSSAQLQGAVLGGAVLSGAVFQEAVLGGMTCDGAVLDQVDLTRANLTGLSWGNPKSASGLILTGCTAQGAVLGGQGTPLDCTGANLASGDFRGADLRGLKLSGAQAAGAILAGCRLDKAILDYANLRGVVARGASFRGASLRGVDAQSASFVRADFSWADLTRARMGAKAWLFAVPGSFAAELDQKPYPPQDLIDAFAAQGVTISPEDAISVLAAGRRWQILDVAGPYALLLNPAGSIDVFNANPGLRPAVLTGAICQGAKAPGASLSGADLRRVQWYGAPATLDHADLEGAALAGSLLEAIDFTQAYLSGADLSGCVLAQARFRGCVVGPLGENQRAFSLEGAQLEGADFSNATLLSALLVDAAVALPQGVPLLSLPIDARKNLTPDGLTELASTFAQAGYPLGSTPTVAQVQTWLIDNSEDKDYSSPQHYQVKMLQGQLRVFDADAGSNLFPLPSGDVSLLANPTAPQALVSAFAQAGYSLVAAAPITPQGYWEIQPSSDAPQTGTASYPRMRVFAGTERLPVYGSVFVRLHDWPQFPEGLAFTATQALDAALDTASLGPSGYPRSWVNQGLIDWETLVTAINSP